MMERKLLRKQLVLLAEQSRMAGRDELPELAHAMCEIYDGLQHPVLCFLLGVLAAVIANSFVGILI